ncbi:MAG: LacI family transcriptional regulator [Lachnospiraceae bacterium]|nr:LacI family transcriptional regulator [Lachnospiraceae bacterium]
MSTIRDVAALADVSPATVSRVLNHDTRYKMTDETREKVWKAVAELNYKAPASTQEQYNIIASKSKSASQNKKLGCVLNVRGGKYNDPYFLSILSGFERQIMESGYEIAFIRSNEELLNKEVLYNTFNEPISGIVLMNTLDSDTYEYVKKQTPNIVGIDTEHRDIDNVGFDHYEAAIMAVNHLIERGYKEIGFIGGFLETIPESKRFRGYYSSLYVNKLPFKEEWIIPTNWDDSYCKTMLQRAYKHGNLPRAFFAASDLMAMAALRALDSFGLKVPDDVAVMGLTNIEMSKYSNPPLTTISLPTEAMGEVAARTLLAKIDGDKTPPKTITMTPGVVIRSST